MIVDQSELPPRSIAQSTGSRTWAPLVTHEAFIHLDRQAALTPKVGLHLNRRNGRVEATLYACAWGEGGIGRCTKRKKCQKAWQGVLRTVGTAGFSVEWARSLLRICLLRGTFELDCVARHAVPCRRHGVEVEAVGA